MHRILGALCVAIAAFAGGCTWGLGEIRSEDAYIRMKRSEQTFKATKQIKEIASNAELPVIVELAGEIDKMAMDQHERAAIALRDHGYPPKKDIDPDSIEADTSFHEYAGFAKAKVVRRKKIHPVNLAKAGLKKVVEIVPWWVRLAVWGATLYSIVTTILAARTWVLLRLHRKKLDHKDAALDEYDEAIERLDPQTRRMVATGEALKMEHFFRNEDRRRDLKRLQNKLFPVEEETKKTIEESGKMLNAIGQEARRKSEETHGG